MSTIEDLKNIPPPAPKPEKYPASTYLNDQQHERLGILAEKSGLSVSKVLARLVDLAYERMQAEKNGGGS